MTELGQRLEFTCLEMPGDERGWVYLLVSAFVGGERIGYLRATWIPRRSYESIYPTVWHYMRIIDGKWGINPDAEGAELWLAVASYERSIPPSRGDPPEERTIKRELASFARRYEREMKSFEGFHVDRPYVSYVHVETPWRRHGVGTALYLKMAKALAGQGLALHSADTQSESAIAFWGALERRGLPVRRIPVPHSTREKSCLVIDLR